MFVDTTFCIDLLRESRQGGGPATNRLNRTNNITLLASVFVICELQAGARMSRHPIRELRNVELMTEHLQIVYPDSHFATAYGECEADLRMKGHPIPTMDLLIGVTAKIHGLSLLTRDVEHFERIPGLVVESY